MAESPISYPFDPSGSNASNKIHGEKHVLNSYALKDYHFIIPKLAPFFIYGLTVKNLSTGQPLIEGVDWVATHHFLSASRATARPLFGSISILDKELTGVIELDYQTIGGDWTIDSDAILQIMLQRQINPRITTWEEITNYPINFPVIDHQWHLQDMVGMNEVKEALLAMSVTLEETADIKLRASDHYTNKDNVHEVNKNQVGLGELENYPPASDSIAQVGESTEHYMTPASTKAAVERFGVQVTSEHESRTDNVHEVTKEQVGLEFVENYPVATDNEAIELNRSDRYMTAKGTGEAIDHKLTDYPTLPEVEQLILNPHGGSNFDVDLGYIQ